jgi:hemerythrin-like metal-binding protein
MKDADLIVWTDELAIGVEAIDVQHRVLVNLINDASAKLSADSSARNLILVLRDLLAYSLFHFDTEEKLMEEYKYAETKPEDNDTHLREHREFSAKVISVRDGIENGILISREDLLDYLNNWLINHIQSTDKRMGSFVLSQKPLAKK